MLVKSKQLAEALRITVQRVNQLRKDGLLIRETRGQWDLIENCGRYVDYLRQQKDGDALRDARAENLRLRNEREKLLLHAARGSTEKDAWDAKLDELYRNLLIMHINFANEFIGDLERENLLVDGASGKAAKMLSKLVAYSRGAVLHDLKRERESMVARRLLR